MLLGLSAVSSKEHFTIHKTCFGLFIGSASVYMCLSTYLFSRKCGNLGFDDIGIETKSYTAKIRTLKRSATTISSMILFYWYHNAYCQSYAYSLFCVTEYFVVLLNIYFHWCAYYDFQGMSVKIPSVETNCGKRDDTICDNLL